MLKPTRTMLFLSVTAAVLLLSACSLLPASAPIKDFTWRWQSWQTPQDGCPTQVYNPDRYTLTLNADRTVSVQADCNSGGGEYKLAGSKLSFSQLFSTEMYCGDESLDTIFFDLLGQVQSYAVENGWLVLQLADGTLMRFSQ